MAPQSEYGQPWPAIMGHLSPSLPVLRKVIVMRTVHDLDICEIPPGSNRSGRIDTYNRRAGAPLGSYWCMSWGTAVWVDAGADVAPKARASCDVMVAWAYDEGLWVPYTGTELPDEGDMILYGSQQLLPPKVKLGHGKLPFPGQRDAQHVGICARRSPYLISHEGNTSWGGKFSRNGECVGAKRPEMERVYGYIQPRQHVFR